MSTISSRTHRRRSRRSTQALVLFAKAPEPGQVKTRLSPPLTSVQAARLHEAFVIDLVRETQRLPQTEQWIGCTPSATHPFFRRLVRRYRMKSLTQTGSTLGERMASALTQLLDTGMEHIVLVGTDVPTLPTEIIAQAFRLLRRADLVLGPACDGGYYLIGVSKRLPPIFDNIAWGQPSVLETTLERVATLRLRCQLLPFWYDVDTTSALRLLTIHLDLLHRSGQPVPHATARFCSSLRREAKKEAPGISRSLHASALRIR